MEHGCFQNESESSDKVDYHQFCLQKQQRKDSSVFRHDNRQLPDPSWTLTIREAIRTVILIKFDDINVESDSQEASYSILDKTLAPKEILV